MDLFDMAEKEDIRLRCFDPLGTSFIIEFEFCRCFMRVRMQKSDFRSGHSLSHHIHTLEDKALPTFGPQKSESQRAVIRYAKDVAGPKMIELAASVPDPRYPGTAEEYLHPAVFDIALSSKADQPHVCSPEQYDQSMFAAFALSDLDNKFDDLIPAKEISMLGKGYDRRVQKVGWKGATYILKAAEPDEDDILWREVVIYRELNELQDKEKTKLHFPRCYGLVTSDAQVMGVLIECIENSENLREKQLDNVPREQKIHWANQIHETVAKLHAYDIVWGDVKTGNVVIDGAGDAWILDFGGGATAGWVDAALEETFEGDEQGLERIDKALGIDKPDSPELAATAASE